MFARRSKNIRLLLVLSITAGVLLTAGALVLGAAGTAAPRSSITAIWISTLAAIRLPDSSMMVLILGIVLATIAGLSIGVGRVRQKYANAQAHQPPVKMMAHAAPAELPLFADYMQLRTRSRLTPRIWVLARLVSMLVVLVYVGVLFANPTAGLFLFWQLTIPVLPALFLLMPGIWRNVCPLAATNQTPRLLKFTRALTAPKWLKEYGFAIGMVSFFLLASSRKWLFNSNGPATGLLIIGALAGALAGGYFFKGKSGWCSSICPLYPVQRLYNRTPFVTVANAYCTPCVGCTKNCYDFKPGTAYLQDLRETDRQYSNYRKFFAAAMPGFVLAFFTLPNPANLNAVVAMYLQFALYMTLSAGIFSALEVFVKLSSGQLTAVYGAAAFSLFYWFALPGWLTAIGTLVGFTLRVEITWLMQAAVLALAATWLIRSFRTEARFSDQLKRTGPKQAAPPTATTIASKPLVPSASGVIAASAPAIAANPAAITFMPGNVPVPIETGRTLLEIAENHQQPIEAGCRMGICGADPIYILDGMENLSPPGNDEKNTLDRLGKGANCRMACMCRVSGPVTVSLQPVQAAVAVPAQPAPSLEFDRTLKNVVIIGNGVAGVTAADYVRRHHPDCAIHLISREKHPHYNRMAITRLLYGRSAMSGLYLQSEAWYEERNITSWLNTHVTHINRGHKQVVLATGEMLPYDRLILASGSSSFVPPIASFGLPGTYVLREADEAMDIRAYVQRHQSRTAVVAGGGLLGLEAAYALHKMGLSVWVIENGAWLLRRQIDEYGGQCLKRNLEAMGLMVLTQTQVAAVEGNGRAAQVKLANDQTLPCDVLLVAAGIRPNVDLARSSGLQVKRGVVVDETMRTTASEIFAAGDVCEFDEQVPGLWQVAIEQAKVAAINAAGGEARYSVVQPMTSLKVVGVDVTSMGRFTAQAEGDIEIALKDPDGRRYRKLVISGGKIAGAILMGYPQQAALVTEAMKSGRYVGGCQDALRAGDWDVLPNAPLEAPATTRLQLPAVRHSPAKPVEQAVAQPERNSHPRQPNVRATESLKTRFHVLNFHFGGDRDMQHAVSDELREEAEARAAA